jgi:hypothetical protein
LAWPSCFFWSFRDDPEDPEAVREYGSSSDDPEKKATFRGSELCLVPLPILAADKSGVTSGAKTISFSEASG